MNGYCAAMPARLLNDPQLLANKAMRTQANNYASAHGRQMSYYALSFDPADDPVVDPQLSVSYIGNSIRSYIYDVTGAWMYTKYACMEVRAYVWRVVCLCMHVFSSVRWVCCLSCMQASTIASPPYHLPEVPPLTLDPLLAPPPG